MRKFYSLKVFLTMCFLCVVSVLGAVAQTTVTFDATQDKGSSAKSIVKGGVTITVGDGILNNGSEYRFYKSQKITITSTSGNITQIVFTSTASGTAKYGPGCIETSDGSYVYSGKTGTWTGDLAEVTFKASSNQMRATKIEVTLAAQEGSVSVPTITAPTDAFVSGTSFLNPFSVTLAAEDGATIYYTTDGTEPTTSSTKYTAPIQISETTTLKAIAEKDGKISSVAQAVYTKLETVNGFAALKKIAEDKKDYYLTFNDVVVTCVHDKYAYMQDGDAGILAFYDKHGFKVGQKISGSAKVSFAQYNGLNELTAIDKSNLQITDGYSVPCEDVSVADIVANMDKYESMRVRISGLDITSSLASQKAEAEQSGSKIQIYQKAKTEDFPSLVEGATDIYVVGYPGVYSTKSSNTNQFNIWYSTDVLVNDGTEEKPLLPAEACNFGDLFAGKSVWVKGTASSVDDNNVVIGESDALGGVTVGNAWSNFISAKSELSFYGKLDVENGVATMSVPSRVKGANAVLAIGTSEGYGTYVSESEFEVPEGVQCGIVKGVKDGKLDIDYIYGAGTFVPEGVPVLAKADKSGSYDLTLGFAEADGAPTSNCLKAGTGTTITTDADHYYYKLAYDDYDAQTDLGFYWGAEDGGAFIVPAGKAYLELPKTGAQVMGYSFKNGEMTGIHQAVSVDGAVKKAYTLDGRKADAENLGKGIYVVNGKKVIVK